MKALNKEDKMKIDFRLTKRKRESTRTSETDPETIGRRESVIGANLTSAADVNKRQRLNPEEMKRAEQLQKTLREIGGQE